jgi:nitrogen fixation NifU-like protein
MAIKYTTKVIEHFKNPHNIGTIEDADACATEGSPACGDEITVYLKIDKATDRIEDVKFQSYGCASNIATGSIITDLAKGKTVDEAEAITWKQAADELGGLPPVKMHCSVLAVDGLRSAIRKYKKEHKGIDYDATLDVKTVTEELKHVLWPPIGADIITLKMVKYIGIDQGAVTVEISINADEKFLDPTISEIIEHVSKIRGVKSVNVENV